MVIKDQLMTRLKPNNCLRISIWINYSTEEVCSHPVELHRCKSMLQRRRRWRRCPIWFKSKIRERLQSMKAMSLILGTKVSSSNLNKLNNSQLILQLTKHLHISSAITKLTIRRTKNTIHIWLRLKKCWNQQSKEVQIEKIGNKRRLIAPSRLEVKIWIIKDRGFENRINNNDKLMPEIFNTRSSMLEPIMVEGMIISHRPTKAAKGCKHQGIKQLHKE